MCSPVHAQAPEGMKVTPEKLMRKHIERIKAPEGFPVAYAIIRGRIVSNPGDLPFKCESPNPAQRDARVCMLCVNTLGEGMRRCRTSGTSHV